MGPSSLRLPTSRSAFRGAFACCVALVAFGAFEARAWAGEPGGAGAEPNVDRARAAYDRGVRAHALGDHGAAARAFAEADALAPKAASLEAALESAMKADDAVLGEELVERADGRAPDAGLRTTLDAARKRFAGRTGKIRIECAGEARCLVAVDGTAGDARKPIFVGAGPHAVIVQRGADRIERLVDVKADAVVVVAMNGETTSAAGAGAGAGASAGGSAGAGAGAGERGPSAGESHGISRGWFYLGVGLTAALGGVTLWSGLDAVAKHNQFKRDGCAGGSSGPVPADCGDRSAEGSRAQTRTNVLLAVTAGVAVTTVAVGIFAVRWKSGTEARMTVTPTVAGASVGLQIATP